MVKKQSIDTVLQLVLGVIFGLSVSFLVIAGALCYLGLEVTYYLCFWGAFLVLLVTLGFILLFQKRSYLVLASGLALSLLLLIAVGYPNYRTYANDNLASDPVYNATVVAAAKAHNYPLPMQAHDFLHWYITLLPFPLGEGSHYFAEFWPDGGCNITRNPSNFPFQTQSPYATPANAPITDRPAWEKGTMIHELAHCFDANLNSKAFNERTSLPPYLKTMEQADTAKTALDSHRLDITLWGEAVADIQQVGFWRLTESAERAKALTRELIEGRKSRSTGEDHDIGHDTVCWLRNLEQRPGPADLSDLFPWANQARLDGYKDKSTGCQQVLRNVVRNEARGDRL